MKQIDPIELRKQIKKGLFNVYLKKGIIYLEDSQNGETIMICNLDKVERR